jgi:predicted deacylase
MLKKLLAVAVFSLSCFAANLHYSLYKMGDTKNPETLFVIGGIHGNEPGGYFAPMILIKHYKIDEGSVWVVPNLNFDSIVMNQRGVYGDMNRKFASIQKNDKDYQIVADIKKMMLEPNVKLILNLIKLILKI